MYEKLLLTAGGGIIDRMQQSEQDGNATLAIGLGGTGIDCLRNLKRKMYNRIKPDDPDATIPEYSHIRFLAVDTDKQDMKKKADAAREGADGSLGEIDLGSEFFDISYPNKISDWFASSQRNLARDPEYREWLKFRHIPAGAADNGAGGIRQLGRFLLFQKAKDFVDEVTGLVRQAKTGLGGCKVHVHIFSGISGGTGAGTFLDACYLVQYALQQAGIEARIAGYFFLPDVNESKPGLPREVKAYIRENGNASLQELDYCMNFQENGDSWHQVYPRIGEVSFRKPPVELCHLVSATTNAGAVLPEAYRYAMNVVTDYVMDFLVKPQNDKFTLESHFSNVYSVKTLVDKDTGAAYEYVVLGAACAVVPFKQVLTYLASELFAGFESVRPLVPSNEDSKLFCKKLGFDFGPVMQRLLQGVDVSFPMPDNKPKDAQQNTALVVGWFQGMKASAEGALARNYTALSAGLDSYEQTSTGVAGAVQSLSALLLNSVREAMADPARGPFWAAQLVRGLGGSDLLAATAGIRTEAASRRDHEQYQIDDHLSREYEQSQRKFLNMGSLNLGFHKAYKEWVNATRNLVMAQTQVRVYQTLVDLMDAVRDQLNKMADNFTNPFANMVGQLFDTFAANRQQLQVFADRRNDYEMPLVDMKTMMPQLQKTVREMDIPAQAHVLLDTLLSSDGMKGWGPNGDEGWLSHMVVGYFVDKFSAFSNKSITSFLQDKYQTTDPDKLTDNVCHDLLESISQNAAPLFWPETGYTTDMASPVGYLTVPQSAPALIAAADKLASSDKNLTVRVVGVRDRISILRCLTGVPMWGYKGIRQYEAESVNSARFGLHLYEGAEYVEGVSDRGEVEAARDWSLLPSPTPYSRLTSANAPDIKDRMDESKPLFEQAMESGVIERTADAEYVIRVLSDSFMQDVRAVFDAAKDKSTDVRLEARSKLRAMSANRKYEPGSPMLSNQSKNDPGIERDIVIDHLAKAPQLQKLVRTELAKSQEIEDDIAALEPKIDNDFDDFSNALFTGVIAINQTLVTYTDPEFGDDTVLSKRQMEFGAVPLYQAYRTFKEELPEQTRESIREAVKAILDADVLPDGIAGACRAVSAELARKRDLVTVANAKFPYETAAIKELISKLEQALKLFVIETGISI